VLALEWRSTARADLLAIIDCISDDNPDGAQATKVAMLPTHPKAFREWRVDGTRELVVRPNYVVVYIKSPSAITILRILQAAQQWP
jgi:toxin ParE1/3/4